MKIPTMVSSGDFVSSSSKHNRRFRSYGNRIESDCIRSPQSEDRVLDCRKKVKFSTSEIRNPKRIHAEVRVKDSPVRFQRNEPGKSNAPKTLEFAFYKKLKEDAVHRSFSHSTNKEAKKQPQKVELSGCSIDYTATVVNSREDFISSIINETLTPIKFDSFLSPLGGVSKNSDGWMEPTKGAMRSKQENFQGYCQTSRPEGNHQLHGGVFYRKRQKLQQYIAKSSFTDFAKFSKGDDIISILLSRLFHNSNLDVGSEFEDSKPMEPKIVTKSKLLAFSETDIQLNERCLEFEMEPFKHQGDSYSELKLMSPVDNRSKERAFYSDSPTYSPTYSFDDLKDRQWKLSDDRNSTISWASHESDIIFNEPHHKPTADFLEHTTMSFPKDGMACSRFYNQDEKSILYTDSPSISDIPYHWYSPREIDFRLCRTRHFSIESDLSSNSLLDEYGQNTPNDLKEHEKISREPNTPLLGWYVDSTIDEAKSFLSCRSSRTEAEQFFTSFDDEQQPRLASALGQYWLPSPLHGHQQDFTSLQNSFLLEYRPHDALKSVLEDDSYAERDANHTSFALSCPMDSNKLANDSDNQTLCIQDSTSLPPQIQHCFRWLISNNNQPYQGRETPLSSLCNFDSRSCCLPLSDLQSPGGARLSVHDTPWLAQKENIFAFPAVKDDYDGDTFQSEGDMLLHVDDMLKLHNSSSFLHISLESNSVSSYAAGWN